MARESAQTILLEILDNKRFKRVPGTLIGWRPRTISGNVYRPYLHIFTRDDKWTYPVSRIYFMSCVSHMLDEEAGFYWIDQPLIRVARRCIDFVTERRVPDVRDG